jgi:hypothetical protein
VIARAGPLLMPAHTVRPPVLVPIAGLLLVTSTHPSALSSFPASRGLR